MQYATHMYYIYDPGTIIYYEVFEADSLEDAIKYQDSILVSWCLRRKLQPELVNGATTNLITLPEKLSSGHLYYETSLNDN